MPGFIRRSIDVIILRRESGGNTSDTITVRLFAHLIRRMSSNFRFLLKQLDPNRVGQVQFTPSVVDPHAEFADEIYIPVLGKEDALTPLRSKYGVLKIRGGGRWWEQNLISCTAHNEWDCVAVILSDPRRRKDTTAKRNVNNYA